jgi:PIN domain nuclease of toxin-antitoxin system
VIVLLDTQAFLWWVADDARLSKRARTTIALERCVLSIASCWEIGIKASLGKLEVPRPLHRFLQEQLEVNGFSLLPISLDHAAGVSDVPFQHQDPFDRLIAVQARTEGLGIVSSNTIFTRYGIKRIW